MVLLLQSGAIFPLLLSSPDGSLDGHARSLLRLVTLLAAGLSAILLAAHYRQALKAAGRGLHMAALIALPFVSVIWSISPSSTLKSAISLGLSMLLPVFIAIRFTPRQLLILAGAVLGACMALSLGMIAVMPGRAFMPSEPELRGIFLHKNVLGWAATHCCIIAAAMMRDRDRRLARLGALLLVASLACLLLSGSATGLLSVGLGLVIAIFHIVLARHRGLGRTVTVLVFLQLVGLLLIFLGSFLVPMLEALGKDATLTGRVPLWRLVDHEIAHHLLLGFGYEAFWTEGNDAAWEIWSRIGWQAPHSHNGYRDIMLSLGLLGLILLAVMVVRALTQGTRLNLARPDESWLWLNVLAGVFLFMNLTESVFLDPGAFPWTLFATAVLMFAVHAPTLRPAPAGLPHLVGAATRSVGSGPGFR